MPVSRTKKRTWNSLALLKVVAKTHYTTGLQDQNRLQSSQPSRTATGCCQPCRRLRSERITTAKLAKTNPLQRAPIPLLDFRDRGCYRREWPFERGRAANSRNWTLVSGDGKARESSLRVSMTRPCGTRAVVIVRLRFQRKRLSPECFWSMDSTVGIPST